MKSKNIKIKLMAGMLLASMAISTSNIAFAANTVNGTKLDAVTTGIKTSPLKPAVPTDYPSSHNDNQGKQDGAKGISSQLDALVTAGTITSVQEIAIQTAFSTSHNDRENKQDGTNRISTQLDALVTTGTITLVQEVAIQAALSKPSSKPNEQESSVIATVKAASFGAIINATSTKKGATQYQVFDGTNTISLIATLGTNTTIFPGKSVGDVVTIKLLNAAGTIIATISVTLIA